MTGTHMYYIAYWVHSNYSHFFLFFIRRINTKQHHLTVNKTSQKHLKRALYIQEPSMGHIYMCMSTTQVHVSE